MPDEVDKLNSKLAAARKELEQERRARDHMRKVANGYLEERDEARRKLADSTPEWCNTCATSIDNADLRKKLDDVTKCLTGSIRALSKKLAESEAHRERLREK